MSVPYQVNLLPGRRESGRKRHLLFRLMVLYVLLTGGLLAAVCYRATENTITTYTLKDRIRMTNHRTTHMAGEARNASEAAKTMHKALVTTDKHMTAVIQSASQRTDTALLLTRLALDLPPDIQMLNTRMDGPKHSLQVELLVPLATAQGRIAPLHIIEAWMKDPHLASMIRNLQVTGNERRTIQDQACFVWKFQGTLTPPNA